MPWVSFLYPAYLAGLALVAIPLALHLRRRRRFRNVSFSDLRFLREAILKQQRRLQVENRRVLLLRILVFLLLVLAVSKPVLKQARTSLVKEGTRSASVIILDNSYSMGCIENGVVRFDRAKRLALDVLKGLKEDDRVTLILASTLAEVVYRALPEDVRDLPWTVATISELVAVDLAGRDLAEWLEGEPAAARHFISIGGLLQAGSSLEEVKVLYGLGALEPVVEIRAPASAPDWDVNKVFVKPGEQVAAGQQLLTLANPRRMFLRVESVGGETAALLSALERVFQKKLGQS